MRDNVVLDSIYHQLSASETINGMVWIMQKTFLLMVHFITIPNKKNKWVLIK